MIRRPAILALALVLSAGCGGGGDLANRDAAPGTDGGSSREDASTSAEDGGTTSDDDAGTTLDDDAGTTLDEDGGAFDEDAGTPGPDAGPPPDAGAPEPCTTRITYGSAWIRGADHPAQYDDARGVVTWDGVCHRDGSNSYAVLSNGWRPYFRGRECIIALDQRGACTSPPPECRTRITYGPAWIHGADHPAQYDDVRDVVTWEGTCRAASGGRSFARLSNGWEPHFEGSNGCALSFRYEQCGGLYTNPVIANDCPDPGVVRDGDRYVLACTGGGGGNAYPLYTSRDLVSWRRQGWVFPAGSRPAWADGGFWAPEIHRVADGRWAVYFSARHATDGAYAIGVATGPSATGPFTDIGRPLVRDPNPGVIDAHYFQASDGRRFLTWKVDGNAVRRETPIRIQELAADGVTLRGSPRTILTNTLGWEGALVEGQWIIERGGMFYLFYSANAYASASYAVGVARASDPLGPYTKHSTPILVSNGDWGGPGHGSVVRGPSGDWVHVYHSWYRDSIGENPPGRVVLVDRITWSGGWPRMLGGPSARSQPLP